MKHDLTRAALDYHAKPTPGKIGLHTTKPCTTQYELSLAYTPGVAEPVRAIEIDPLAAYRYTAKANLVGVITNGSAVLGLGNTGALASKPVMEGKAVLFKQFADIDVFDIEVNTDTPEAFIETVTNIAPTFGGINLEDIAGPHCFEIEQELVRRLDIPVFHDDQHGTAIIIAVGLLNALELKNKKLEDAQIVCLGAGAAGTASMQLLHAMGVPREHTLVIDRRGVIHTGREDLGPEKRLLAVETDKRTLSEAMEGADVFIGVSGPNLVNGDMLRSMAPDPLVFALSNPDPEINLELAHSIRSDLIMATGRSDYCNQVNNVLGFPFIFRGALDVCASAITREMHIATVEALRELTHEPVPEEVLSAYQLEHLEFGPEYIIPKPLDPRLIERVPPRVSEAAIRSGVARLDYLDRDS